MKDYWTSLGFDFKEFSPCNQGTQKGYRLDCWVLLTDKLSGDRWLYQVEIKNWSAHSIGGKRLSRAISDDEMAEYRRSRWRQQFDIDTNVPRWNETKKVLTRMKPLEDYLGTPIRPMLCFWEPMHPQGSDESFFGVETKHDVFDKIYVFSMSNHVRNLLKKGSHLTVECPNIEKRLNWLNQIYF
jgi:hypothetical protein